jgi:polar amino acid transport system permease protein
VAEPGRQRSGAPVAPRRRLPGSRDTRAVATALASTVVVFTVLAVLMVTSPGWEAFKAEFLDGALFRSSFPEIARAFALNIKIFCIAEVLILVLALGIAVIRSLPGPVFFPLRVLAIVYTDIFRGLPTIMVVYMLAFGIPALLLSDATWYRSATLWSIVALTLVYSAYVAEVYRAGIQSVHPSQDAAARSLGLSRWQALRHVILPQAVRRVIPPLLNDFIGLQKDTALVAVVGPVEAFRQAQIAESANFNFTPYLDASLLFLLLTIPLARLTDYLIERDRRRFLAGGGA